MMILIAGPYRSGTNDDPALIEKNVHLMASFALPIFRAGHIPILGEWLALPLVKLGGSSTIGDAVFNEVFHPIAVRLLGKCDAVLRVGGPVRWRPRDGSRRARTRADDLHRPVPDFGHLTADKWAFEGHIENLERREGLCVSRSDADDLAFPVMLPHQMSASEVLSAFHRDAPYLFLGAAFVAVGIVSAAFSGLRRKRDPLLLYLAIYAILYGMRMWIRTDLLGMTIHGSSFYLRLRFGINYIVPIPAILFFNAAGFFNRVARIAAYVLLVATCLLAAATFAFGYNILYDRVNSVIVIAAIVALVFQATPAASNAKDFIVIRRGLLVMAALVVWDNLRGVFQYPFPDLEPFGFAVFLGCLGYVAARRTLAREQELSKIQEELEVARRIQSSILPVQFPESPHFRVSARYLPMTSVAGDFYDYVIAGPKQAGLLIADVSGHGVPAALIASMVKLAAAAQRAHADDPSLFLSRMNAALYGNTQSQFVTAAYAHLDSISGELRYSAAGHPPMLLLRRGEVSKVEENGLILAAFDFATYSTARHRLEQGDRLLLYTDGVVEATNANGDFFGIELLAEVFRDTSRATPSEAIDRIVAKLQSWAHTQEDDLTLLVCDYIG